LRREVMEKLRYEEEEEYEKELESNLG